MRSKPTRYRVVLLTSLSKTSFANIHFLDGEDDAHCVGTTIKRRRYESRALSQGNFEVGEHLTVAWGLNDAGEGRRSIAEDIRHHDHVIPVLMRMWLCIRAG